MKKLISVILLTFVLVGKIESIGGAATTRKMYTGYLDAGGNATVSVSEIILNDMPVVVGYVYSTAYAEPGYVMLGNIIPSTGTFRYAAGVGNANQPYILVADKGEVTGYIKGYVKDSGGTGISGVTVTLSGTTSCSYTTTSSGYYEFLSLAFGNYTVTPSKSGYSFNLTNNSYSPLSSNQDNQNFIGTPAAITYYIKGYIKDSGGTGISSVTVTLSGSASGSYTTTSSGYYEFLSLASGNYIVTPSTKAGYTFTPVSRSTASLSANISDWNFESLLLTVIILVDPTTDATATIKLESGCEIKVEVTANTFAETVNMAISTTTPPSSDRSTIKVTNVGLEIKNNKDLQPSKEITITITYSDSDVVGFDETKLVLGRYDETNKRWITLPSTAYPEQNKVVGITNHLCKFALIQLVPATNLKTVYVYSNPYKPGDAKFGDTSLGTGVVFSGLTNRANIKIYNIAGESVGELEETNGDGRCLWDTRNKNGSKVASGVYIYYITNPDDGYQKAKGKLAIIK
ncbi:MAG: SdrD B-like domain-containing protein [Elusimicrobiota bacterium]